MRGAGHNFGIVTSFNYKIYDQPVVDWFVATLVFTQDKLEAVFEQMNVFGNDGNQPVEATVWILYLLIPEISTTEVNSADSYNFRKLKIPSQYFPGNLDLLARNPKQTPFYPRSSHSTLLA